MMRATLLAAGIAVVLLAGVLLLNSFYHDPAFLPPDDFLQYWAAGRLNATGGNPYDADQLLALQRSAGRPADKPAVMMWNPPWVLSLAMPFGLLTPRTAQLAWLLAQLGVIVFAADRLWKCFGGSPAQRPWVWGLSLAFYPVMYITFAGQSSAWLLLGLVGVLLSPGRRFAWLILFAAVKPHLFVPVWIALACEAIRTRQGRSVFAIGVAAGLVAMIVPSVVNPEVWSQYFAAMNRPVDAAHSPLSGWKSPLIGYWVRAAIAPESFWIQAVPTALVAFATPMYWWFRRTRWNWTVELPRLVLAGLIASPYGAWPYDQIVLLVPVLAGFAHLLRNASRLQAVAAFVTLGIANGIALTLREGEYFVWLPPVVALWYAWAVNVKAAVAPHCHSARIHASGATA
jgi:hypothetical protein